MPENLLVCKGKEGLENLVAIGQPNTVKSLSLCFNLVGGNFVAKYWAESLTSSTNLCDENTHPVTALRTF